MLPAPGSSFNLPISQRLAVIAEIGLFSGPTMQMAPEKPLRSPPIADSRGMAVAGFCSYAMMLAPGRLMMFPTPRSWHAVV